MEDIGGLAQYLASLSPAEQGVRREAFLRLLTGQPADLELLSRKLSLAIGAVREVVDTLAAKGIVVFDRGREAVVGSGGLSLLPTEHRLAMDGRHLFTWCAADAVGIPAALGKDAVIDSACHTCGTSLRVELAGGEITPATPEAIRVWVVEADTSQSVSGHT